jgi:pyruvate formate lyase activating enzyme
VNDALKLAGRAMTPNDVMEIVRKDSEYYANSGGGVTLSGGEPMLHPEFCAEIFAMSATEGIHTALDTAANVPFESYAAVLPHTRAVLLDLKIMDPGRHKEYTGSDNRLILENARRFFHEPIELYIRIPVIAGVNDNMENAGETARFIDGARNVREVKLLPYHGLGADKARSVGVKQETFRTPDHATLRNMAALFSAPTVF